jgi:hypothetical protein
MFRILVALTCLRIGACVENITLYRITRELLDLPSPYFADPHLHIVSLPLVSKARNYTGVTNLDTGDAGGDAFFGLYELATPILCSGKNAMAGVTCTNVPILQIPGFNVYTENVVEVDTRFGDYSECNPTNVTPSATYFSCGHFQKSGCWTKNKKWKTEFQGICSDSECSCDVIETKAVGKKYPLNFGPPPMPKNSSLPKQCTADFFPIPFVAFNATPYSTTTTNLASCCSSCTSDGTTDHPSCSGYTYKKDSLDNKKGKCELFHIASGFPSLVPNPDTESGFFNSMTPLQKSVQDGISGLATILDGSWYSTRAEGECKPGQTLGTGDCWWRLIEVKRNINATCVNNHLIENVKQTRPECWSACPQPDNITSSCWIQVEHIAYQICWLRQMSHLYSAPVLVRNSRWQQDFGNQANDQGPNHRPFRKIFHQQRPCGRGLR